MGINVCCTHNYQGQQKAQLFTAMATFQPTDNVEIKSQHRLLFERLKKRLKVSDSLRNPDLKWHKSVKYNIFLYGRVQKDRPFGECFFYVQDDTIPNAPLIIATSVDQHYVYSNETLVIYPDDLVYYGSIKNNLATFPRAEGNGLLFSPNFLYEGQFKNGAPHGFGHYRSKKMEYVGDFKNGEPFGEGLKKTAEELFIGEISDKGVRNGFKITRKNEKIQVSDAIEQSERALMKMAPQG